MSPGNRLRNLGKHLMFPQVAVPYLHWLTARVPVCGWLLGGEELQMEGFSAA